MRNGEESLAGLCFHGVFMQNKEKGEEVLLLFPFKVGHPPGG